MTRFVAPLAALMLLTCVSRTAFAAPKADPALRFQNHGITLVVHRGAGPVPLQTGTTPLDEPAVLNCHAQDGCIITFQGLMGISGVSVSDPRLSSFVDGIEARPHAFSDVGKLRPSLQSFHVAQGQHMVQTLVLEGTAGMNVVDWEINYTLYDNSIP